MLIQFSVRNFKTFKDKATLSLVASNYDKDTREVDNVIDYPKFHLRLLKSAVIYGANASGKSKFMEALMFMKRFVISSSKESQKGDEIAVEPFRLSTETEDQPSEFEVIFLFEDVFYRYGFEVDNKQVVAEWLFHKPKTKEVEIFYREYQKIEVHAKVFQKGATLVKEDLIRDNALMLSVAAQFNDINATKVLKWFDSLTDLEESIFRNNTSSKLSDPASKDRVLELMKAADIGIHDISNRYENILNPFLIEETKKSLEAASKIFEPFHEAFKKALTAFGKDISEKVKINFEPNYSNKNFEYSDSNDSQNFGISTSHPKYDNKMNKVEAVKFSLKSDESKGTQKFFSLVGPILDALDNGEIIVADELDTRLHPNLLAKIVELFNSKEQNPNNAQLIFNTHDTNLLSSGLFRRDQVWFTEKNKYGEAKLFSLADFKDVRKGEALEDNYIRGKYGAVPFLGFFDDLMPLTSSPIFENEE